MSEDKVKGIFAAIIIVVVMIWLSGIVAENYGGGAACIFFIAAWLFGVPAVLFGPDYVSQWLNEQTDGRFGCGEIGCLAVIIAIVAAVTKYFGIW